MINFNNPNNFLASLVIEELVRLGADTFFISPGSRSTPLTAAVAANAKSKKYICYDERGAAFAALGFAKGASKPAVLICSSGTAVANYFPAIVEAFNDAVPLIILTADRPGEVREAGAHQTIDQIKIFGSYVNLFLNLAPYSTDLKPEYVLSNIDLAYSKAMSTSTGPVHLNFEFREPLAPTTISRDFYIDANLEKYQNANDVFTKYIATKKRLEYESICDVRDILLNEDKGIIILGSLINEKDKIAVKLLTDKLNWPVFPDILSGVKNNSDSKFINHFDYILGSNCYKIAPKSVMHIGGRFVSKRLQNMLDNSEIENYILVSDDRFSRDPSAIVTHRVVADIEAFCLNIADSIDNSIIENDYIEKWNNANSIIEKSLSNYRDSSINIDEINLPNILGEFIPDNSALYLGSGMPIRDFDTFFPKSNKSIFVSGNRGANGIDGVIASAIGFGAGADRIVTLVIGDLSSIHDLNSLHLANRIGIKTIIILINDHGGGLFRFLPIAKEEIFDEYFLTPHKISFEPAAKMFGLNYFSPSSINEFIKAYNNALLNDDKSSVIELVVDSEVNYEKHKSLGKEVKLALDKYFENINA